MLAQRLQEFILTAEDRGCTLAAHLVETYVEGYDFLEECKVAAREAKA